jgi:hypothetical protein
MRKLNLKLAFVLTLTLGGCSQILGIGDYEIDPKLDPASGSAGDGNEGGDNGDNGTSGKNGTSGTSGTSGSSADGGGGGSLALGGQGGEPMTTAGSGGASVQAGAGGQSGESNNGGAGGEGGQGEPPGVLVPCSDEDCCTLSGGVAKGVELLRTSASPHTYYGDFELGKDGEGSPWSEASTTYSIVVDADAGSEPHQGTYFAWLAGVKAESSYLTSEAFAVPADAGWLTLSGYRKFQLDSAGDDELNTDYAFIALSDADTYLEDFYDWGPEDPGQTGSWSAFELSLPATGHQGETRYLDLVGEADDYSTDTTIDGNNYMFDELSLKVFRCYEP